METLKVNDEISITKKYFMNESLKNQKFIKDIKLNKKSITIYVSKDFKFNCIFDKRYYLNLIIMSLNFYLLENYFHDYNYKMENLDYLKNKFKKLYVYKF